MLVLCFLPLMIPCEPHLQKFSNTAPAGSLAPSSTQPIQSGQSLRTRPSIIPSKLTTAVLQPHHSIWPTQCTTFTYNCDVAPRSSLPQWTTGNAEHTTDRESMTYCPIVILRNSQFQKSTTPPVITSPSPSSPSTLNSGPPMFMPNSLKLKIRKLWNSPNNLSNLFANFN